MKELENKLKDINGGLVLDIGSGRGEFIHFITNFGSFEKITAVDTMEKSGELIKKNFPEPDIDFVCANAKDLPFEDETFDTVCISNSLHHLEEMPKILKEMKRVLKIDGNFIVNEMHCDEQNEAQMSHVLLHHWFARIDTVFGQKHDPTFSKQEIRDIIEELELIEIEIIDYHWPACDPKEPEMLKEREKIVDAGLKKLPQEENFETLRKEGEEIRSYIQMNGFAPAGSLFVIGRK
ncbi:class I SAM-dependent methyltransferase [Candidatus Cloacimonadota bacterium]